MVEPILSVYSPQSSQKGWMLAGFPAGRNIDDLPDRARIFFKKMILPPKALKLVIEAQRRGIDLDRILQEIGTPNQPAKIISG